MDFIHKFGSLPGEARLHKIKASTNYKDGSFKNLSHTPDLTEGSSYYSVMKQFVFGKKERVKPVDAIPSVYTDIKQLPANEDALVWFGHSSYYLQVDGKKILVDPVFSGAASPVPPTTPAFKGADRYTANDLPEIDYLLISHDHWDHLDYETIMRLKPKVKKVFCGLGIGEHLEHWGYDAAIILKATGIRALNPVKVLLLLLHRPGISAAGVWCVIKRCGFRLFCKHPTTKFISGAIVATMLTLPK